MFCQSHQCMCGRSLCTVFFYIPLLFCLLLEYKSSLGPAAISWKCVYEQPISSWETPILSKWVAHPWASHYHQSSPIYTVTWNCLRKEHYSMPETKTVVEVYMPSGSMVNNTLLKAFTVKEEKEDKISFLDVKVERCGMKVQTAVFRKKTHTDR